MKAKIVTTMVIGAAVLAASADAQAEDYFDGKRINLIVTWSPGGTGDVYGRILARHLPKHIAGEPRIVVENMPGGGHNIGANFLYNRAKPDGLTFGLFPSHRVIGAITDEEGVEYEADKFTWLASVTALSSFCAAWHEDGVTDANELKGRDDPLIFGSKSTGDIANTVGNMAVDDLGWNLEMVTGYKGDSDIKLAIESGELEATCAPWPTLIGNRPDWESENLLRPLFVVSPDRDPTLPDVPSILEFDWSEDYANALTAYTSRFAIGVPVAAPPGVPEEVANELREAMRATFDDPEYQDEVAKAGRYIVRPLVGDEVQAVVDRMYGLPESAWEIVTGAQR